MKHIGIEAINLYGSTLYLDQTSLAEARGQDPEKVVRDFLIDTRSLNPPFEDTVTMGANAAYPLFEYVNKDEIGLLIVGTEGSVDYGKPISTNIHGALELHPNIRNYETKHACYSGVAALDTAINWIASGLNRGKKALVISTDFSRKHLNAKEEFVLGGVAAAVIVSEAPKVIEYELEKRGTWTTNAYDTFRPTARDEVGNNEVSLFTYMDAIEGAYDDYCDRVGAVDFDADFVRLNYHTPFPGMAFQAHRTLCNKTRRRSKQEVLDDFEARVVPGLMFARRVGSTYGSSNFVAICGMFAGDRDVPAGSRIGFFAYGSGAIGEFYSGMVCEGAAETVRRMGIERQLDARRKVTVSDYERIEGLRDDAIDAAEVVPDLDVVPGLYDEAYRGKHRLVLKRVEEFYRTYEWS